MFSTKGKTGKKGGFLGEVDSDVESLFSTNTNDPGDSYPLIGSDGPMRRKILLICCFIGWYVLNVAYVIENKKTLNTIPLPWTLSALQLSAGWIFAAFFWCTGFRNRPQFYDINSMINAILPQGIFHLIVHLGAVISMGLGAVSFTHVIKSGEPVVTAILSAALLNQYMSWQSYLALFPIIFGVALSSAHEIHFNTAAFVYAMISNVGSAIRAILAKNIMSRRHSYGKNIDMTNIYTLMTLVSSMLSIPVVIFVEGRLWVPVWIAVTNKMTNKDVLCMCLRAFLSGVWYYFSNELGFICLSQINQVSHAVANTIKRIAIIAASLIVFKHPVSTLGLLGAFIAILGTCFYSICRHKWP
ncbi:protoporphyrinogen oxidase [Babesia microti strain RI]|uniref:Protoporphyrinogen oxidase n=1 Tax=Babesia microti (strain RI) TaxID=1133968 RepID=I7IFF5_BABMR|nr:protoporphyrinogen oxidase [Babesia microti strain RI]CCF72756.1 protoporphyrinogen oxidase [Babesia microti strain RI]|eukprot:XP_012647365.1 protoporphyrinogen oxidase [Babesia microti strain RI]